MDKELLLYIYQNSEMGMFTTKKLATYINDSVFKEHLQRQAKGYQDIMNDILSIFSSKEELTNSLKVKLQTYMMMNLQTIKDKSNSHIASMLMQGSAMGIIDTVKRQHQYRSASKESLFLLERLHYFEENNFQVLKLFL